jgi:hypothetical protein
MIQWEYKVVHFKSNPGTEQEMHLLNEHSKDGWEHYYTYIGVMLYYFKRQKTENK